MFSMTSFYNKTILKIIDKENLKIEHYGELRELSPSLIQLDEYSIEGEQLFIIRMEDNEMEIKGKIKKIEIK